MVKIWMRKYDKINPAGNPGLRVVLNSEISHKRRFMSNNIAITMMIYKKLHW